MQRHLGQLLLGRESMRLNTTKDVASPWLPKKRFVAGQTPLWSSIALAGQAVERITHSRRHILGTGLVLGGAERSGGGRIRRGHRQAHDPHR